VNQPSPPVFVITSPRSGTTWLLRALNTHPEIFATELRAFGEYVDMVQDAGAAAPRLRITLDRYVDALLTSHQWEPLGGSRAVVRDDLVRTIYRSLRDHALSRANRRVFLDKLTPYFGTATTAVDAIARLFPQAKVILLVRDGRDVAVSGVMHWLTKDRADRRPTPHQVERRASVLQQTRTMTRFFSDDEVTEWALTWRQPIDAVMAHNDTIDCLVVRYESMLTHLDHELRRLFAFLEVGIPDGIVEACVAGSTFEVMSGGRRRGDDLPGAHVRKGVVGDWHQYFTHRDAALFNELAGDVLIDWGYEPDDTWAAQPPQACRSTDTCCRQPGDDDGS